MGNPMRAMYETDENVELTGVVLQIAPGVEARIARAGGANKKFAKVMATLRRPYRRAIQTETLDDEIAKELLYKAYARAIVLGWEGFTKDIITKDDADADTVLPFNEENCIAVFRAQENFFLDVVATADRIALYRAEVQEVDSKN